MGEAPRIQGVETRRTATPSGNVSCPPPLNQATVPPIRPGPQSMHAGSADKDRSGLLGPETRRDRPQRAALGRERGRVDLGRPATPSGGGAEQGPRPVIIAAKTSCSASVMVCTGLPDHEARMHGTRAKPDQTESVLEAADRAFCSRIKSVERFCPTRERQCPIHSCREPLQATRAGADNVAIEAVIWDFGGVLTSSPFEAFARFEARTACPRI